MSRFRRLSSLGNGIVGIALALGSLLLYVKTAAPTLLMADPAEFQLACNILGVVHPTGYPLYVIVGWLWSHLLPLGDAAYRINLLSALFAAAAVGLTYLLVLKVLTAALPGRPEAQTRSVAILATLTLAVSRTFWSQALRAEVYALNSLFVVVVLLLLLRWSESRSPRTLELAALIYGLSLTHHRTMIFFLPSSLLFVWLTDRSVFRKARFLITLLALVAVPQVLYLYIPWRAPVTPYLHVELAPDRTLSLYDNTLGGFLGFVMGEMFRGELGVQAPLLEGLSSATELLLRQFGLAGVALGVVGLVRLVLGLAGLPARSTLALLGLSYAALLGFTLVYNVGDIHVFYTPSYIIFALWIAVGMAWLVDVVRSAGHGGFSVSRRAGYYLLLALLALLPLSAFWNNYPSVDKSRDYRAREWAEEILAQPIPQGAILVSNDRNEITPLLYLPHVEGQRPDLLTMFPLMLPGDEYSNVVRVLDGVLDVDRPIYLVKPMPGLEIKYRLKPSGPLVEIRGPAITGEPEKVTEMALGDSLTLVGYDVAPAAPLPGGETQVSLYWRVERTLDRDYHTYVHLLDEGGQAISQSDHRPGQQYYPSSLWQPGETLLDVHALSIPANEGANAVSLVAGAYEYPSLVPLGSALSVGELPITR
ncbi:MAG TPA: DUF2723 domain-containing protein [Anaerolineae bacterium]|nr:DUF2723 domain-containing protein [Anaerolineae bacterium]